MKNFKLNVVSKYFLYALLVTVLFTSCADVTNIEACTTVETYGFWSGLWHGIIAPFAWIGSLFSSEIAIYAVNNNGGWYDFGFIIGIGALTSSSTSATRR